MLLGEDALTVKLLLYFKRVWIQKTVPSVIQMLAPV